MRIIKRNDIKIGCLTSKKLDGIKHASPRQVFTHLTRCNENELQYFKLEKENGTLLKCDMHPFVQALHYAYCEHLALNLSPDHIWYLISSAVSMHMHFYADKRTRKKFLVADADKKEICVRRDDFARDSLNPWYEMMDEFCMRINENVKPDLADYMSAAFTTTSRDVRIVSQIMLADDSKQKAFRHEPSARCGIAELRILGCQQDWERVRAKANMLVTLIPEFKVWMKTLNEILQHFIDAFNNTNDNNESVVVVANHHHNHHHNHNDQQQFWNNIYKCEQDTGGPFITGWILGLFPYLSKQEKNVYVWKQSWRYSVNKKEPNNDEQHCFDDGLTAKAFTYTLNQCPFKWMHLDQQYDMLLIGGLLSVLYDDRDQSITPIFGHAVIENN